MIINKTIKIKKKGNKNIRYSGDEFLTNYYSTNYDNEIATLRNPNKKINFPEPL